MKRIFIKSVVRVIAPIGLATNLAILPWVFATNYSLLEMQNIGSVTLFVQKKVNEAKKVSIGTRDGSQEAKDREAVLILQNALLIVLARPNKDNMISKVITPLRWELNGYGAYIKSMSEIVDISVRRLKDRSKKLPIRATYLFVLENIMEELLPEITKSKKIKALYKKIYKKGIKVPKDVVVNRQRNMFPSPSPSETALSILKNRFPKEYPPKSWWKFW